MRAVSVIVKCCTQFINRIKVKKNIDNFCLYVYLFTQRDSVGFSGLK